jgi:hypothetical protein
MVESVGDAGFLSGVGLILVVSSCINGVVVNNEAAFGCVNVGDPGDSDDGLLVGEMAGFTIEVVGGWDAGFALLGVEVSCVNVGDTDVSDAGLLVDDVDFTTWVVGCWDAGLALFVIEAD